MAYIASPPSARYATPQRPVVYSPPVAQGQFDLYQTTQSPITTIRSSRAPVVTAQQNYFSEQRIGGIAQPTISRGFGQQRTTPAREYGVNLYENIRGSSIESTQTNHVRYSNSSTTQIPIQRLTPSINRPTPQELLVTNDLTHSRRVSGVVQTNPTTITHMTTSVPAPLNGVQVLTNQPKVSMEVYRPLLPSSTMYMFASNASHRSAGVTSVAEQPNRNTPVRVERSTSRTDPFIRDSSVSIHLGEVRQVQTQSNEDAETLATIESENNQLRNQIQKTQEEKELALQTNKLLLRKLVNLHHADLAN